MAGATESELRGLGHRCVVVLRTGAVVVAGGAAIFQAPGALIAVVVGGLCLWSVAYLRYMPRLLWADTVLIAALCLAQGWLVRPDLLMDISNWIFPVVVITAVAHQWFTAPASGVLLTGALVTAHLTGLALHTGVVRALPLGLTALGAAGLSRLLRYHLFTAAARADRAVEASERSRRQVAVAAAQRADEREHLAVLHDTAAATLLAVGTRMVDGTEPWLAEQAARDLEILAEQPGTPDGETDLAPLLDDLVARAPVSVRLSVPRPLLVPAAPAAAIGAAVREALTNVARHAGVAAAEVAVVRTDATVVVTVTDDGRGFTADDVPSHRRGVAESIEWRMRRAGGRATVTTRPGHGTVIRLEWPVG
jgi:glucose-6-phosphate-specific signal transduction histidine kinase